MRPEPEIPGEQRAARAVEASDDELVELARRDPGAFAPLYARYASRVYWYAYYRLGSHGGAEDAAAAAFERALANIGACRPGRFRAWLFTIARNAVTDAERAERRPASLDLALAVIDLAPDPPSSPLARKASGASGSSWRGCPTASAGSSSCGSPA